MHNSIFQLGFPLQNGQKALLVFDVGVFSKNAFAQCTFNWQYSFIQSCEILCDRERLCGLDFTLSG